MTLHSRVFLLLCTCLAIACDGEDAKEAEGALPPALGTLELAVSLRTGDPAPSGAIKVEANPAELRVDDKVVVQLDNGRVPADQQQDGTVPALTSAFGTGRAELAMHLHSALPYETAALVLSSAARVGIRNVAFQVRKAGSTPETGWMSVKGFSTTSRTDEEVPMPSVTPHEWDEFTGAWEQVYEACRAAKTGSCAYVQQNVAKGGNLKIVLHAAGQGVNLNFFRVGLSAEALAAEKQARESEIGEKKRAFLDGRGDKMDLEKELLEGEPATQALFQFRAQEALAEPSPLSATLRPVCGASACGAVLSAESNTLMVRVMSLIGAAFPDGVPAPTLAFELPWTEKPAAPPPTAPSEGEAAEDESE